MKADLNLNQISYRDRIVTVDDKGHRKWIRAKQPKGKHYNQRSILTIFYLTIFFLLPFLRYDGRPLFLLNIVERKFIIFGTVFWPQDLIIFGLMMVMGLVFIALFTVIYGRIFCGWVCPQTIFMEMIFRRIEYWIEGTPQQQKKLKEMDWNSEKIIKKGSKHFIFWMFSFLIANTFLAYIIGTEKLFQIVSEPVSKHIVGFLTIAAFTTVFYTVFTFVREQVCLIVCPYGRLQGVLVDSDTVLVSYDYSRGEPRGMHKKNEEKTTGDCIDCKECVKVCPTGIDIRNGTQLECVNCTACIDACNEVMVRMNQDKGLIRYTSENGIKNKKPLTFTWRMKAYTGVLLILLTIISTLILTRRNIDSTIVRTGGLLTQLQTDGRISNLYKIKVANKTYKDAKLELRLENANGEIKVIGTRGVYVNKESTVDCTFFIIMDKNLVSKRKNDLKIGIYKDGDKIQSIKTTFLNM